MGHRQRRPKHLGRKLRQIREALGLSQQQVPARLGDFGMHPGRISEYETGERVPSLLTLLAYADLACINLQDIVNDNVELPEKLPGNVHHGVVPSKL